MYQYYLQQNPDKTKITVNTVCSFSYLERNNNSWCAIDTKTICTRFVSTTKSLGICIDQGLGLKKQVIVIKKYSFKLLRDIIKRRSLFNTDQLKLIIKSLIICKLDYCNAMYYGISEKLLDELQMIQNASAKAIVGLYKHDHLGIV